MILIENSNIFEVEELKKELVEQEDLRSSLEEKIKQLTKLILVSAHVDNSRARTSTMSLGDPLKRGRSTTMRVRIFGEELRTHFMTEYKDYSEEY